MKITRRGFIQTAGAVTAAGMVGAPYIALGAGKKVVVVGGGTGGALRRAATEGHNPITGTIPSRDTVANRSR